MLAHPMPVEDCYAGLTHLADHAASLGVDPKRIAVMGEGAGGGLATAIAMLARDRNGPALAKQILTYVEVRVTARDLNGNVSFDEKAGHVFQIKDGLINRFDIRK